MNSESSAFHTAVFDALGESHREIVDDIEIEDEGDAGEGTSPTD